MSNTISVQDKSSADPSLVVSSYYSTYPQAINVEVGKRYLMIYANCWYQDWMATFPPSGCDFVRLGGSYTTRGATTCFVDVYYVTATANQISVPWYGNGYPISFTLIALD